ncbi:MULTISPECIES: ribose-5-phosphate isomerase RpiA [unclassified Paracoccus (in: a-proteobacteria)]|uniref:ribose-5-phosphate isomerase RpiA n=1 Tax=unclassified Paracoccus (in: a-proteobacteria) TaxID=2688777 RepID=UPI0018A6CE71|nr:MULTISPECIES: ribose-5-phosphate isomerase RpiA [unclassified Paracoccus (in: a-proteobacteria)]UXU74227.1 ribose-5-phosphate isomerase RpiA [Paracoccus sp. SMMA_5]UXU80118.1 ribose-5-phosphate isomerase RpiA [Paracoccus sp. SMMA_5_TC]
MPAMTDPSIADLSKDAAARAAVALVAPGMRLGLGTGSTAAIFVRRLAQRVKAEGFALRCAATSRATAELASSLGLQVEELDDIGWLDLTIDGADEVDPDLNLIKGGGAAHLREKIVATASDRMVVIADQGKVVERLGAFHLPVEVIPFGWQATRKLIQRALDDLDLSQRPILLRKRDDKPLLTDEGNYILDLALEEICDPQALARRLSDIAGVVEHGLFLNICEMAIIGCPDGSVVELRREDME